MRTGPLRHLISIQSPTESQDAESGEAVYTFAEVATRWGAIEDLSGRELSEAQQIASRASVRVRMRHYSGLTTQDRLVGNGRTLEVVHAGDPEGRGRVSVVLCTEAG